MRTPMDHVIGDLHVLTESMRSYGKKRAVRCGQVTVVSRFCCHTADEGIV